MMPLPKELSNVILPHEKEGIVLMNYREYLQNAFLLEETILIPFLAIIKYIWKSYKLTWDSSKHGSWVKCEVSIFLQEMFSTVLEIKTQNVYQYKTCNILCLCCGQFSVNHKNISKALHEKLPMMCPERVNEEGIFIQLSKTVLNC